MKPKNNQPGENIALLHNKSDGFSMVEIVIVLTIMLILTAVSVPYFYNYKKMYKSEDQALKILDLLRETSQHALTRRRTMRFEIDLTENAAVIIDENGFGADDDREIKLIPLTPAGELRMDTNPSDVSPPDPPNYNNAVFEIDTVGHKREDRTIINNRVWAARFKSDGSVVGHTGTPVSATIYMWSPRAPDSSEAADKKGVRAITLFGGSGAVRYWKHDGSAFIANK